MPADAVVQQKQIVAKLDPNSRNQSDSSSALGQNSSQIRIRPNRARKLTKRQHACLVLVARGKTDREIGAAIGISRQTVHKHIEQAKKHFKVRTRIELVVRALHERKLDLATITGDGDVPRTGYQ